MTPETIEKKIVKQYLDIKKYFHFHLLAGMGAYLGCPDMVAIKNGKVYLLEVKKYGGKQSPGQRLFQDLWEKSGGTYIIGTAEKIIDELNETDTTKVA